jgi:Tfp pilus assembly protein FimT
MKSIDLDKLEEIAEGLGLGFYMLMFMALVTLLAGAAGPGFELLIAGSLAQVGRAGIEEFIGDARSRAARPAARPRAFR